MKIDSRLPYTKLERCSRKLTKGDETIYVGWGVPIFIETFACVWDFTGFLLPLTVDAI